jgi:hypothetical protein
MPAVPEGCQRQLMGSHLRSSRKRSKKDTDQPRKRHLVEGGYGGLAEESLSIQNLGTYRLIGRKALVIMLGIVCIRAMPHVGRHRLFQSSSPPWSALFLK